MKDGLENIIRERICPCCKKTFYIAGIMDDWAYKNCFGTNKRKYYCSWGCLQSSRAGKVKKQAHYVRSME